MSTFEEEFSQFERNTGGRLSYFKFKEGDNVIRIVAEPRIVTSRYNFGICYDGAPYCLKENLKEGETLSRKFKTYIINRLTGNFEIADLPYTIAEGIMGLKKKTDYGFATFPMPYDITISARGAGTKEVSYQIVPARNNTSLTTAEQETLNGLDTISEVIEGMKLAASKKANPIPSSPINYPEGGAEEPDF
jgi:hypothetical protein